jgi:hypothetical protein
MSKDRPFYNYKPEDFKVGDIIVAYRSGYHQITRIYTEYKTPQIEYVPRWTASLEPATRKTPDACHIIYCRKVDADYFADEIGKLEKQIERLNEFQKELQEKGFL